MFPVIESFLSLDGEGPTSGELAYFIRFAGCNLRCSWCDTDYSWDKTVKAEEKSAEELFEMVHKSGVRNVTLTGGEPLLQKEIDKLLALFAKSPEHVVHIETNGSVPIRKFREKIPASNIIYILDYKLPVSGMEDKMDLDNLKAVTKEDVYKFVIASEEDLDRAVEIVKKYNLDTRCQVFFSPVREEIDPLVIVERMKKDCLNHVRLQLQLHKILWPKEMRGV